METVALPIPAFGFSETSWKAVQQGKALSIVYVLYRYSTILANLVLR